MTPSNIFGKGITVPGLGNVKIRFSFKGRTTNVRIICSGEEWGPKEMIFRGWSRRSMDDRDNRSIGRREALAKALKPFETEDRIAIWDAVFTQSSKMKRLRNRS